MREALSLIGWVAAFWLALRYANPLAELFLSSITIPSLRIITAFTGVTTTGVAIPSAASRRPSASASASELSGPTWTL